jgi:hypothetical protein
MAPTRWFLVLLALSGVAGCASSSAPAPAAPGAVEPAEPAEPVEPVEPAESSDAETNAETESAADEDEDEASSEGACVPAVTVAVVIVNRSSYDLEVYFDGYRAGRTADGFTRTTYQVPRYRLHRAVTLNILRGGLQVGGPASIPVEQVYCNDATILVGAVPRQSIFYGDKLYVPEPSPNDGGEAESDEPPPEDGDGGEGSG